MKCLWWLCSSRSTAFALALVVVVVFGVAVVPAKDGVKVVVAVV